MFETGDERGVGGLDGDVEETLYLLGTLGQEEDKIWRVDYRFGLSEV